MVTTYKRPGPPTHLIIMAAIAAVLGCALVWLASINFFETNSQAAATTEAQQQAVEIEQTSTAERFQLPASPTPRPPCQVFVVSVTSAFIRECPAFFCDTLVRYGEGKEVCVYGAATTDQYEGSEEWLTIDLNPNGAFPDLVYMHSSVLKPANPTPRPTRTFTPLPTVTLTPTFTLAPTETRTPTPDADSISPEPTLTPLPVESPTLVREEF